MPENTQDTIENTSLFDTIPSVIISIPDIIDAAEVEF